MNIDFKVAIFDMDGTLLDTMRYWRYTSLEYLLAHQLPISENVLLSMHCTSSRKLIPEYLETLGLTVDRAAMIEEFEGYMNRHYLYDAKLKSSSVESFLAHLKRSGVRMCVATGAPRQYAKNGLARLGILDYFEFVTDNYEGAYTKDRPEYFEALIERLGVSRDSAMVFEDALYAIEAAKACGLRVCAIEEDAQSSARAQIMAMADLYIRDYGELMR